MSCEFTVLLWSLRTFMGRSAWKGWGATCNVLSFFVSFTLLRVIMFAMLCVIYVKLGYLGGLVD